MERCENENYFKVCISVFIFYYSRLLFRVLILFYVLSSLVTHNDDVFSYFVYTIRKIHSIMLLQKDF